MAVNGQHRSTDQKVGGSNPSGRADSSGRAVAAAVCWAVGGWGYDSVVGFARITSDPGRMGGVPCIRELRFPVATVVAMVADGMSTDEILAEHPDLEADDIAEALRYAALAVSERELPLRLPV